MQKLPPECWCDHEFVVLKKRSSSAMEKYVIAIFDSESALVNDVKSAAGVTLRRSIKLTDIKEEEVYNRQGKVSLTRAWRHGGYGTIICDERSTGEVRTEKCSIFTLDGRPMSMTEKTFCGTAIEKETESRFNADASVASTATIVFQPNGHIKQREAITWFGPGRPAIVEITNFADGTLATDYTKTMHNTHGAPLWQEKISYPKDSAKPSKKELIVFSAKSASAISDVSEYREDGSVAKHILSMLENAANAAARQPQGQHSTQTGEATAIPLCLSEPGEPAESKTNASAKGAKRKPDWHFAPTVRDTKRS